MSPKSGLFTKSTYLAAMFAFNKQKLSVTENFTMTIPSIEGKC